MLQYHRRLPHRDTTTHPLFVTFRLHGSLPANRLFPPTQIASSGKAFAVMDHLLDTTNLGPLYLRRPEIAALVVQALHAGETDLLRYQLHAFVVMPNHVHLLVTPSVPAIRWLAPLKGFTSHAANTLLGLRGHPFWQDESYDHIVRTNNEFSRIQAYIEANPVRAGLVQEASHYPWSSAHKTL